MARTPRWGEGADEAPRIGPGQQKDPHVYTDPERLTLEREHVFRHTWHIAGHQSEIPAPGDFKVWERFGQSVVIARQADGSLAAFHNVCRHRGARIAAEGGACPDGRLTCPFHGFAYDLTGKVVAIPERASFDPARLEGLRAHPVSVEVWDGWLCIHLDPPKAEPIDLFLGELREELGWYDMGSWAYHGSSTYVAEANWKSVLEGFLETWHAPFVHPSTIRAGVDVPRTTYATLGPHSMMVIPLEGGGIETAPAPVEHQAYAVCHYLVFAFAFFNLYPDQGVLTTVYPIDESRTAMEGFVVGRSTPPEGLTAERWERRVKGNIPAMDEIVAEDLAIAAEIGATRHSFGYAGNLYNTHECRIVAFHRELEARIQADRTAGDD